MIQGHADTRGYFRERLRASLGRLGADATPQTEHYLVNLLAEGSQSSLATFDQPVALRLAAAMEVGDPIERALRCRKTGDAALYTSGFFPEHLERRGLQPAYIHTLGRQAYRGAAACGSVHRESLEQLADDFGTFVRALAAVREEGALRTPQDIVRLYDRWKKTGDQRLAERLQAEGVFPALGNNEVH